MKMFYLLSYKGGDMKNYFFLTLLILIFPATESFMSASYIQPSLSGAWQRQDGSVRQVIIVQDGYFSHTTFDQVNKKFIGSFGGQINISGNELLANIEFDTNNKERVGQQAHYNYHLNSSVTLQTNIGGAEQQWLRADDGKGQLAGNWRITARTNNGQLQPMQRSARKTLKLLSGTRFQWMAINPETKEFFGTGGGSYTFQNGKYTEHIEFFSRDSSRVGASLSFDGSVSENIWTHKGLSSRGEPIHEEWTREK
jgi:hypothetical protein